MDTKWKKWCNSLCIAIVLIAMTAGGIIAVNQCNNLGTIPYGIGTREETLEDSAYFGTIEQKLIYQWAKQEKFLTDTDQDRFSSLQETKLNIPKGVFVDAKIVMKPYGKKMKKISSEYSYADKEYGITGNEWSNTITVKRDSSMKLNKNGSFQGWKSEFEAESEFYTFHSSVASGGSSIGIPNGLLINDEKSQRLESATIKILFSNEAMSQIRQQYENGQMLLKQGYKQMVILIGAECLGILLLIVLFALQKQRTRFFAGVDRIWWEIICTAGCCMVAAAGGILIWILEVSQSYRDGYSTGSEVELVILTAFMLVPVIAAIFAVCVQTTVWRLKERKFLDTTLCIGYFRKWYRTYKKRKQLEYEALDFVAKHTKDRIRQYHIVRRLLLVFVLLSICTVGYFGILGWAAAILGCFGIKYAGKYFDQLALEQIELAKLVDQIQRISEGELTADTDIPKESEYYEYSQKLLNIGSGMEKALETQMKGERMKIDLITNVSHDLKTPLTSIIGYVDLLSRDKTLSDEAKDYVQILMQKTDRLKNIISDLFELAKSTSGEAKVELESMDMKRLVEQTLGDMADQIEKSGFVIRFQCEEGSYPFRGDVNRMYRVVQNVIENALKYSMEGTRIFLRIEKKDGNIQLEVINTASYEMDFTEEEIMERFARAEKSRSSEGNGLGLSIADSFTKNCGGQFHIEIHGDQFKVMIVFKEQ